MIGVGCFTALCCKCLRESLTCRVSPFKRGRRCAPRSLLDQLHARSNYRDFQAPCRLHLSVLMTQQPLLKGMGPAASCCDASSVLSPSCLRLICPEEVARHNTEEDCWVIVGDLVLDFTQYLTSHPGGKQAILNFAGDDATQIFDLVHHRGIIKKYGLKEGSVSLKGSLWRRCG